jgi:hypothetical protein
MASADDNAERDTHSPSAAFGVWGRQQTRKTASYKVNADPGVEVIVVGAAHRDQQRVGSRDRFVTYAQVAFQSHIKSFDIPPTGWLTVAPAPYAQATDSARVTVQEEECSST